MTHDWRLSRRGFLLAAAGSALLAACGQAAGPASTASSGAAPASASAVASSSAAKPAGSASSVGAAATGAPADWQQQWDSWVAGAKKEGKLVLASGPSPSARAQIPEAFKKAFGVDVEYLGGATSDLANRLRSEQSANQFTVDVSLSGSDSSYIVLYGEHMTEPIKPYLIRPDVLDPAAWKNGKVWYTDPGQEYIVRASSYVSTSMVANTNVIKVDDLKSWNDLLKPQFKGKMATYDPIKSGSGSQLSSYIYNALGGDYFKKLYVDQGMTQTSDYRQLSDWLARGTYPVAFAMRTEDIEQLRKDGFKVQQIGPWPEAPGYVSAGFGLVNRFKSPPHPNAANLFVNWILMKDGQIAWNQSQKTVSVRTDVDNSGWAPPYLVPQPGVKYFDTYDWDYATTGWSKANKAVQGILGS
jgi:iron(III) transport system substrate-binding protein